MKKLINVIALFVLTVFFFTSCSSTEPVSEVVNNHEELYAQSPTIQQLKAINEGLIISRQESRATNNQRAKQIVLADVRGAVDGAVQGFKYGRFIGKLFAKEIEGGVIGTLVGAVTGGSYSSFVNANETRSELTSSSNECLEIMQACNILIGNDLNVNRDLVIVGDTTQYSSSVPDSILNKLRLDRMALAKGELHNIILSLKEEKAYLDPIVMMPEYDCIRDSIYKCEELADNCATIALNIANNIPSDNQTLLAYIIDLFEDVFNQYANDNNDMVHIINQYIEVIDASEELSENDKDNIKSGLSTAIYSFNYWNIQ